MTGVQTCALPIYVARAFGSTATLVTYDGWGHVIYKRSKCVASVVDRYLMTLLRPPAGRSCPPVEPASFGVG